jgi:anaerobic ribonucleoside-triphosphate reductase activating protein
MKTEDNILNVYKLCKGVRTLGPGLRYVIWVQGCMRNCNGCTSPESRPMEEKILVDIDNLTQSIIENQSNEGITISGGEPFLQASKLIVLLKKVKEQRPDLNVIIYTGFSIEDLIWDSAQELLVLTDLLIDGEYIENLNDSKGIRGSSNQRFHYLTEKLKSYQIEMETGTRNGEIYLNTSENNFLYVGVPNKGEKIKF